ncbi:glycosyl transferase [Lentibacillus kapialis]|uniref:Glycosyl transferase n=1 Tax=Lentibacillus kapialis TaxID=340214 RepID=A0A917Q0B4_9BACI|nr:glycosyltransferase [Lentibacillus kapialis]GGK04660.1 glycosyl transferase [Lentibacillus kapialis]
MKLCFLSAASIPHTVRWVNAMAERGHDVTLISMHKAKMDTIDARVRRHHLKIPAPAGYYLNALETKLILSKVQPDVLHVHFASGYGTLARFADYHPALLSVWGSDVFAFPDKGKRQTKLMKKNLSTPDKITSTSHAMKWRTQQLANPHTPIDVIPFGVDPEKFKRMDERNDDSLVIGTVKRLETVYGIDRLLKVAAKLLDKLKSQHHHVLAGMIRLKIVGDGSQLEPLRKLARDLNINDVTEFIGSVPNDTVPHFLNQFDIYCAFSRRESFGVAVLEASACEVPVIASDVEGLPEVVKDGETGFLIEEDDWDEASDKLLTLVTDRKLRKFMGKSGRAFVEQYYNWEVNVSQMENVYNQFRKKS